MQEARILLWPDYGRRKMSTRKEAQPAWALEDRPPLSQLTSSLLTACGGPPLSLFPSLEGSIESVWADNCHHLAFPSLSFILAIYH